MSPGAGHVLRRQLWEVPTLTSSSTTRHCTPFTLPSNGILELADSVITLTTDVVFQPECTGKDSGEVFAVGNLQDPFYASTIPMAYAIAAATVIAWILVIMLVITPRAAYMGSPIAAPNFSSGHGMIGGANGGGSHPLVGAGTRPWLQKVATLAVAISLTIATADTFKVAKSQYSLGYMDAGTLRREVLGSVEIRTTRAISDVFLWLAQVQTLIRLFPRHKEKVLIKWIGFALILFDTVFSCLNSFLAFTVARGRHFVDAIPALCYLFELALGLLYAAWVIYYAMTKRRYAFYHSKMRNICLIALLSMIAILTPVVFFVTDVSNSDVAGWGDYFRWVGAAAASVVVWEWVERIEALERDEKKDGILGREVFDGDEMLDASPSEEAVLMHIRSTRQRPGRHDRDGSDSGGSKSDALEQGLGTGAQHYYSRRLHPSSHYQLARADSTFEQRTEDRGPATSPAGNVVWADLPKPHHQPDSADPRGPSPPTQTITPVSRSDTLSAASTVYVVNYGPGADAPRPVRRARGSAEDGGESKGDTHPPHGPEAHFGEDDEAAISSNARNEPGRWRSVPNPFKRKRLSPPQEVQQARAAAANDVPATTPSHHSTKWDFRRRLGAFAADDGDRSRDDSRQDVDLPLTVIPAQPRSNGRVWSPADAKSLNVRAEPTTPLPEHHPAPTGGEPATLVSDTPRWLRRRTDDVGPAEDVTDVRHSVLQASRPSPRPPLANEPAPPARRRIDHELRHRPPRADIISPGSGQRDHLIVVPAPPRRLPPS